jgi:hypothetical protein
MDPSKTAKAIRIDAALPFIKFKFFHRSMQWHWQLPERSVVQSSI